MSVLENAKKRFNDVMNQGLLSFDSAWGTIYYKPSATLKETETIMSLHRQGKMLEACAMTLILRAFNEDGSKMFKQADLYYLMNDVLPNELMDIASQILESEPDVEDIAKN